MKRRTLILSAMIITAATWSSAAFPSSGGSAAKGKVAYQDCTACHGTRGQGSDAAPNIRNMVGRKVAGDPGFAYSGALRRHGGVWTEDRLVAFLLRPQATVKGNRMPYDGAASPAQAQDLVAYLKTMK